MRLVDLRKRNDKVNPKYMYAEQPMPIYYSLEEYRLNEPNSITIFNIAEFQNFLQKNNLINTGDFEDVQKYNVFLSTGEKFVPDKYTPDGQIIYQLESNKLIPTDNCFIKLFVIHSFKNRYLLFTSSGIFKVSISEWNLSAAVKNNFLRVESSNNPNYIPADRYKDRLKKILETKKVNIRDMRLLNVLLNPLSDAFMNVDKAVKEVYGEVKKEDRVKIIETEKFRNLLIKELGVLMPDIKKAIQEIIPPKDIAVFFKRIAENAVDNENVTVDDKLKAVNAIIMSGYSDEIEVGDDPYANQPLVGAKNPNDKLLKENLYPNLDSVNKNKSVPDLNLYDDADAKLRTVEEMKTEELKKYAADVGYTPGFSDELKGKE